MFHTQTLIKASTSTPSSN